MSKLTDEQERSGYRVAPVYLVLSGEMLIEAPVSEVWRHVLNYGSWQDYSEIRTVEGTPGAEGEVVLLRKAEKGFIFPPYHARTLKIESERKIVWKTYLDPAEGEAEGFGIVEFRLYPKDQQTTFWYNLIYEFLVRHRDESELTVYREMQRENFAKLIASTHPKLKRLAESGAS